MHYFTFFDIKPINHVKENTKPDVYQFHFNFSSFEFINKFWEFTCIVSVVNDIFIVNVFIECGSWNIRNICTAGFVSQDVVWPGRIANNKCKNWWSICGHFVAIMRSRYFFLNEFLFSNQKRPAPTGYCAIFGFLSLMFPPKKRRILRYQPGKTRQVASYVYMPHDLEVRFWICMGNRFCLEIILNQTTKFITTINFKFNEKELFFHMRFSQFFFDSNLVLPSDTFNEESI